LPFAANDLKTHARPNTPFLITKTPGKWIILDLLPMTEHYASICAVLGSYEDFFKIFANLINKT